MESPFTDQSGMRAETKTDSRRMEPRPIAFGLACTAWWKGPMWYFQESTPGETWGLMFIIQERLPPLVRPYSTD
jgi:hypothetical protein